MPWRNARTLTFPETRLTAEQWMSAVNSYLPPTIRVLRSLQSNANFHARFSAKGKIYRYRVWNDRVLPPSEFGRSWHVANALDVALMKRESALFIGRHDFAAFAANRGRGQEDTTRTIDRAIVRQAARCITLEFSGDGFLYKMVRLMVGTLVQIGLGKLPAGTIAERLRAPKRQVFLNKLVAPAEGLFLVRVRY